ncbi:hypothetical protein D3C80_1666150 [compost metagenome]
MIELQLAAVAERDDLLLPVDGFGTKWTVPVDIHPGHHLFTEQAAEWRTAIQQRRLGERWAFVKIIRLVTDHRQPAAITAIAQRFRCPTTGLTAADNDNACTGWLAHTAPGFLCWRRVS